MNRNIKINIRVLIGCVLTCLICYGLSEAMFYFKWDDGTLGLLYPVMYYLVTGAVYLFIFAFFTLLFFLGQAWVARRKSNIK